MHVLCFTIEPTSSGGGAELSAFDLCKGLYERGHDVSLAYLKQGDLLAKYQAFCKNILRVEPDRNSVSSKVNMIYSVAKWPLGRDSLIYTPQHYNALLASTLSLIKNVPYIAHLRNPPHTRFNFRLDLGLKGVAHYIAVSEQTRLDWLSRSNAKNIEVVYNGIDVDLFKPAPDPASIRHDWRISADHTVITYVGRLHPDKGIETLIKTLPLVAQQKRKVKLLVAGKPTPNNLDYQDFLEKLIIDLGVEEQVSFLGHVDHPISLFQASDVTVLPSLWSEPFGRTVIESMACGTPAVASRTGGIPEILTGEFRNGLFEPGKERSLADALSRVIHWRDEAPHLGERCREHIIANFTVDKTISGVESIMLKVIKKKDKA